MRLAAALHITLIGRTLLLARPPPLLHLLLPARSSSSQVLVVKTVMLKILTKTRVSRALLFSPKTPPQAGIRRERRTRKGLGGTRPIVSEDAAVTETNLADCGMDGEAEIDPETETMTGTEADTTTEMEKAEVTEVGHETETPETGAEMVLIVIMVTADDLTTAGRSFLLLFVVCCQKLLQSPLYLPAGV